MKKSKVIGVKFTVNNPYNGVYDSDSYTTYEIVGEKESYYKCMDLGSRFLVMITKTFANDLILKQNGKI